MESREGSGHCCCGCVAPYCWDNRKKRKRRKDHLERIANLRKYDKRYKRVEKGIVPKGNLVKYSQLCGISSKFVPPLNVDRLTYMGVELDIMRRFNNGWEYFVKYKGPAISAFDFKCGYLMDANSNVYVY